MPDTLPGASSASNQALSTASHPGQDSAGWRAALAAWLQAHKTYPEQARRNGEQGRVLLRFTVARDGMVTHVEQASGSGSAALDAAAAAMLHGARLPPFPATMTADSTTITVGIRYDLRD